MDGAMGECGGVHLFPCRVCTQGCRKNVRVFFGELFRLEGRTPSERAEPDAVLLFRAEIVGEAWEQRRTISPIFLKVDERRRPYAAREERDG